jgi:uroporphyrinogen decarboxylase
VLANETNFERFKGALFCEGESDRVPLGEFAIDVQVKSAFLGRPVRDLKDDVSFWAAAGYDYCYISIGMHPLLEASDTVTTADRLLKNPAHPITQSLGGIGTITWERYENLEDEEHRRKWADQHEGVITNWEEFDNLPWVDADDFDYGPFYEVERYLPPGMKVVAELGYVFAGVWTLMGFETFADALVEQPELVTALFEKLGSIQYGVLERLVSFDSVGAVRHSDDIAYSQGLLVSPQVLRRYLFPWLKRYGDICHASGLPFIFHSDGNLSEVIDDVIACGFNALHPIEPTAMDIKYLKEKYGDKLCLIGNVGLDHPLTRGTPQDVELAVKQLIHEIAPGGGFAIGSSNGIPGWVPVENYQALREASMKYGRYPIAV